MRNQKTGTCLSMGYEITGKEYRRPILVNGGESTTNLITGEGKDIVYISQFDGGNEIRVLDVPCGGDTLVFAIYERPNKNQMFKKSSVENSHETYTFQHMETKLYLSVEMAETRPGEDGKMDLVLKKEDKSKKELYEFILPIPTPPPATTRPRPKVMTKLKPKGFFGRLFEIFKRK